MLPHYYVKQYENIEQTFDNMIDKYEKMLKI
jgi:hypothetical protein